MQVRGLYAHERAGMRGPRRFGERGDGPVTLAELPEVGSGVAVSAPPAGCAADGCGKEEMEIHSQGIAGSPEVSVLRVTKGELTMKKLAIMFMTASMLLAAADAPKTFTGTITDSMCGMDHKMMNISPDSKCAREC